MSMILFWIGLIIIFIEYGFLLTLSIAFIVIAIYWDMGLIEDRVKLALQRFQSLYTNR